MDLNKYGLIVEAETTECAVEVYLNGVPVGLCGIGARNRISLPVHEYLVDGKNELGVLVNPGDTPATSQDFSKSDKPASGAQPPPDPSLNAFLGVEEKEEEEEREEERRRSPLWRPPKPGEPREWTRADINHDVDGIPASPTMRFTVKMSRYPVGTMAGDSKGVALATLKWSARDNFSSLREQKQPFPFWQRKEAFLGPMFGRMHWEDAQKLKLDEKTHNEAKDFAIKVRDMIEKGDAEAVIGLSVKKFKEVARSYGISATERANIFRRVLAEESKKETWVFETPEDEDYSLRTCAGDRMIECVARDWKPLVRGVESERGRFLYPMFIGKIQDQWLILR